MDEAVLSRLPIVSVTPFTLQDFPGRTACILWFTGCNFACPYCHNAEMAMGKGRRLDWASLREFLRKRRALVDGVVLSGGESCLNRGIVELADWLRGMGFAVKVDTNGSRPEVASALLEAGAVTYWALDYKAPRDRYEDAVGWGQVERWERTARALLRSGADFEIRTTVHPDLLDEEGVNRMLEEVAELGFRGRYYVQHYVHGPSLGDVGKPTRRFDAGRLAIPPGIELGLRNFSRFEREGAREDRGEEAMRLT